MTQTPETVEETMQFIDGSTVRLRYEHRDGDDATRLKGSAIAPPPHEAPMTEHDVDAAWMSIESAIFELRQTATAPL